MAPDVGALDDCERLWSVSLREGKLQPQRKSPFIGCGLAKSPSRAERPRVTPRGTAEDDAALNADADADADADAALNADADADGDADADADADAERQRRCRRRCRRRKTVGRRLPEEHCRQRAARRAHSRTASTAGLACGNTGPHLPRRTILGTVGA